MAILTADFLTRYPRHCPVPTTLPTPLPFWYRVETARTRKNPI